MTDTDSSAIARALAPLGAAPLSADAIRAHVAPLFSRVLEAHRGRIYLANHSLGRPLDAVDGDVRRGLGLWYTRMGDAWDEWSAEIDGFRARIAALCGAPRADAIVPKTSAGQGLRAVLNTFDNIPRVVATRGEFDSLDVILREYARRGRIALRLVEPGSGGEFASAAIVAAISQGADLVVVSEVIFSSGQRIADIAGIVEAAHATGARVLVDVYHSLGVVPVDVAALDVDFAVGGSYKYLRGGPGACFLYVAPRHLDAGLRTLDIGWFAKDAPFRYERPDPPRYAQGGDGWMESTPPILQAFQAKSGQEFTQAIGVARLRAHSLRQQRRLVDVLAAKGIDARGGTGDRGAFVVVRHDDAPSLVAALEARAVVADARGPWLRLCPDVLTTDDELLEAAARLAEVIAAGR